MSGRRLTHLVIAILACVAFSGSLAAIAARPWQESSSSIRDPRLAALDAREKRLERHSHEVKQLVKRRWTLYRHRLKKREHEIAAAQRRHARALKKAQLAASSVVNVSLASAAAPVVSVVKAPAVSIVKLPPVAHTKSS